MPSLLLRITRAETPAFRFLKKVIRGVIYPKVLVLPRAVLVPFRLLYEVHYGVIRVWRSALTLVYSGPMFQSRCASFGRQVSLEGLPFIAGPVEIHVGDGVSIGGKIAIISGSVLDKPQLILKDRVAVGWSNTIIVNREVVIEEDVIIAPQCRISDSDGHPREADLRAAGKPPHVKDIRPVRICRYAWIGTGAQIMKGVTIGEGAIVATNSVVMSNIPPYCLAVGNPAEVLFRNYGKPTKPVAPSAPADPVQ